MHGLMQTVFGAGLALGCAREQRIVAPTAPAFGPTAPEAAGELDGKVESESGLTLHIRCVGEGQPVVVFDDGLGQGAEAWADFRKHDSRGTARTQHTPSRRRGGRHGT
jgi:hypothetical protein